MQALLVGRRALVLGAAGISFVLIAAGCEGGREVLATEDAGQPPETFATSEAGAPDAALRGLCATNECPANRATCVDSPFPCAVDLTSDDDNCGACGAHCPNLPLLHARTRCIEGECKLGCDIFSSDCNGLPEDGCETDLWSDSANCGACGNACPGNFVCHEAKCICPIYESCGACGNICPPDTEEPFPPEWNATRACVNGECNKPMCDGLWRDCNQDFGAPGSDGCETDVGSDDQNCGQCGKTCAAGEICAEGVCVCMCGASCFDLETDPDNCGGCFLACPGDRRSINPQQGIFSDPDPAHGRPVCDKGICDYRCSPNWGDCDGNIGNGCETDLRIDPSNCGGCGIRCTGVEGQACIDGVCATKDCPIQ